MKLQHITMPAASNTRINIPYDQSNDEINLIEIIILLWKEKMLILATAVCFLIPTLVWIMLKPPIYTVDILIDNTSPYNIESLEPSILIGGERYQVDKLDKNVLFQNVITQLETLHTQKLFWEKWSKQPLTHDPQKANTKNDTAFVEFAKNLTLTKPDPKKTTSTVNKITLATSDPVTGITLLNAYTDFLNRYIVDTALLQIEEGYISKIEQLKADHARLTNREQQKLQDKLIHLTEQWELARSLKIIETPYEKLSGIELNVVDNRLYLLGATALAEEIKTLRIRQEKQPGIFVSELRDMENWQKAMEHDIKKLHAIREEIRVFELTSPPVSSIESTNPRKLLIVLASLFLSLLIGSIGALIKQGINNHKERLINIPC